MVKKVLVVDNNKVFLRMLSGFLEGKGYEVKTAEDGLAALAELETFVPEVIFIDLVMPLIDGERLCRIIRKMPAFDTVVLVIVSAVAAETRIDFSSFGADACVAKGPFKGMQAHLNTILDHVDAETTSRLQKTIYGVNEVHERQVTRELIAVRRHFEITVDSLADGFLELTPGGSIVYANRAAAMLLGGREEQLLATALSEHFPVACRQALVARIAGLGATPVGLGGEEPLQVNGRQLLLKFVSFEDDGHRAVLVLLYDVTERKRAEKEWQQRLAALEELVAQKDVALEKALTEIEALRGRRG